MASGGVSFNVTVPDFLGLSNKEFMLVIWKNPGEKVLSICYLKKVDL